MKIILSSDECLAVLVKYLEDKYGIKVSDENCLFMHEYRKEEGWKDVLNFHHFECTM